MTEPSGQVCVAGVTGLVAHPAKAAVATKISKVFVIKSPLGGCARCESVPDGEVDQFIGLEVLWISHGIVNAARCWKAVVTYLPDRVQ